MESSKFGDLGAIVVEPDSKDLLAEQTVVLLHGYGAPGTDLVGLASELSARPSRYVFLQAPHVLAGTEGPFAGRAWWNIDMMALQVAVMTRNYEALARSQPEGLDEATEQLDVAISDILRVSGPAADRLYVGGFSQGAMLSCNWALLKERPIAGLIQLSGTVLNEDRWRAALPARRGLRVFQSHSPDDPVLPFELALRLKEMFEGAGTLHTWASFRGGHGIGPSVLRDLSQFLGRSL